MSAVDYFSPTAVANEAIDASGLGYTIGDLEEGSDAAQVCLRHYYTCLDQLLRAAPWNIARKEAPLTLLADATGQTDLVGTSVPAPWIYCYAYPIDCVRLRYIPWNPFLMPGVPSNNIVPTDNTAPLMTNLGQPPYAGQRLVPARFLVTSDVNNLEEGASNLIPGSSPIGRMVICTNVQNARGIYSYRATWVNLWDSQFRQAMVAYLAATIAQPLWNKTDPKMGMQMRAQNIAIAQQKVKAARVSDGQEGFHSSDLQVDWMRRRNSGGYGGWASWWANVGDWSVAWDNIGWGGTGNSSAY